MAPLPPAGVPHTMGMQCQETPCLVLVRDAEVLGDLPPEVLKTIASARASSMRRAYAFK